MKKILSLIVALLMAFTGAAMAEATADSTISYIALIDPVASVDGTPVLDMTGLAVEMDIAVAESAAAVFLHAYVGENYDDNVVYAQAQLDKDGIVMGADGLSNLYSLSSSSIPGGSALPSTFPQAQIPTPQQSIQNLIDHLAVSSEGGAYTLALSREDGTQMIQQAVSSMAALGSLSGTSVDVSDMEGVGMEMRGEASVPGDGSMSVTLSGELFKEGEEETIPLSFNCDLTAEGSLNTLLTANVGAEFILSVAYAADIESDDAGTYATGSLSGSITVDGSSYVLNTFINTGSYSAASADWIMDGSSAIDVASMDEAQMNALQMGAVGILGTAATKLQENVPGMADIMSSLVSGMMG